MPGAWTSCVGVEHSARFTDYGSQISPALWSNHTAPQTVQAKDAATQARASLTARIGTTSSCHLTASLANSLPSPATDTHPNWSTTKGSRLISRAETGTVMSNPESTSG